MEKIFIASEKVIKVADRQAKRYKLNTLDVLERSFVSAMLGLRVEPSQFEMVMNLTLAMYRNEFERTKGVKMR